MLEYIGIDARTGISYGEQDILAGKQFRVVRHRELFHHDIFRLQGNGTYAKDGIPSIDNEIRQNLVDLGRIESYLPEVCAGYQLQVYILADKALEYGQHA